MGISMDISMDIPMDIHEEICGYGCGYGWEISYPRQAWKNDPRNQMAGYGPVQWNVHKMFNLGCYINENFIVFPVV